MNNYRRWLIATTLLILTAGWLGMTLAVKLTEEELRSKLLLRAETAATMISYERVEQLTATAVDSDSPNYEYLREQLIATRAVNTDCRFVYLLTVVDKRMVFLADSELTTSADYSPPGSEYNEASDALRQIFIDGKAFIEGPLSDEWGTWVSGLAAVRDPASGQIVAVLGMDIAARDWQVAVTRTRLTGMGITLAILMVMYALFYALQTSAKAAERVYLAEKQAKEAVESVSLAKSQFMAYLSHEIRASVNGILGLRELLETTLLDRQQRDYVVAIDYSARSLLTVLNDVLDFSKIEANKIIVENVDFAFRPLLEGMKKMLQAAAINKGLELVTAIDQSIPQILGGDPARLQQVLLNLVGNAIKFTDAGRVEIKAACLSQDANTVQVKITVADTGIGLEPDEMDKVFQPFAQAESTNSRKYMGTGLGLSISASLVKLMDGDIGVASHKGEGSVFWITIPFRSVASDSAACLDESILSTPVAPAEQLPAWLAQPIALAAENQAANVLIVEDNPVIQQVLISQLRHLGLTPEVAGNGPEAVQKALNGDYKLIFMDCGLPVLDGMAATRLIRDKEAVSGRHIAIIALTGRSLPDELQQCLAAGMDDVLVKPVSVQELRQMVERWLPEDFSECIDRSVLRELKQLADSGQSHIDLFIDSYLEELPSLTEKLRNALLACDAAQASAAAHSLKSMSATIGALRLGNLFGDLEQLTKNGNCVEARTLMAKVDTELRQVGPALKRAASLL